jgi:Alkylmercury lyase
MDNNDSLLWQVRHFVYSHFADTTRPPSLDETAHHFNITVDEASELYNELNNRHAFFLEPGTLTIRMAWPFSAVPTNFKVHANGKTYYANCAWDMIGIPVVLQSDAFIEAICTESNDSVQLEIKNGQVTNSDLLIHFPLSFSRWYEDLVFT